MISAMLPLKGYRLTKHLIRSIRSGFVRVAILLQGGAMALWTCRGRYRPPRSLPHVGPISMAYLLTVVQLEYSHVYFCKGFAGFRVFRPFAGPHISLLSQDS